jgi:zearalenone synthase (highly reducing iterative type I polyketide synthase)
VNKSEPPYIFSTDLLALFNTAYVTIACENAEQKAAAFKDEFSATVEAVEHGAARSDQSLKDRHFDVIVVSDRPLLGEQSDCMFLNIMKVLKPAAKLCILADDEILAWFQSKWQSKFGQSMVFRGTDRNLIIATRASPDINDAHDVDRQSKTVKIIIPGSMTPEEISFVGEMTAMLTKDGYLVEPFEWTLDVSGLAGSHCISLLEMSRPVLHDLTEDDFNAVRNLILTSASLLWITGFDGPSSRIIDGLARVVRNETPGLKLRTLHANDRLMTPSSRLAELIPLAFSSQVDDDEFVVKDGFLHIGRIEEDHAVNRGINTLLPGAAKTITKMPLRNKPFDLKLNIRMPGMLDTLCLEFDERVGTELHPEDVEIDTKVSSMK